MCNYLQEIDHSNKVHHINQIILLTEPQTRDINVNCTQDGKNSRNVTTNIALIPMTVKRSTCNEIISKMISNKLMLTQKRPVSC